ncbi:hypothetical protein NL676_006505 [Syzygium grande]|nr:hypothetical protein NL676_006505 [Syzygium grande]
MRNTPSLLPEDQGRPTPAFLAGQTTAPLKTSPSLRRPRPSRLASRDLRRDSRGSSARPPSRDLGATSRSVGSDLGKLNSRRLQQDSASLFVARLLCASCGLARTKSNLM